MSLLFFIIMLLFLMVSIYWSIYLRIPQISKRVSFRRIKKNEYNTFFLSLATNLGVGNIVGVSTAILIGGPGVIFWMLLFSLLASSIAYVETFYAIKSQVNIENETFGGTCYTIDTYFKGKTKIILSTIFAIFLLLSNSIFFTPVQLRTIYNIFEDNNSIIFILITVVLILLVVFKGTKTIINITNKVVPLMTILFLVVVMWSIILKWNELLDVIMLIIKDAFKIKNFTMGSFIVVFNAAISKSLFSNEAGLGTIPSLTGTSKQEDIYKTSYLQLLSVIIDTCILCTITGIFILLYYDPNSSIQSIIFIDCLGLSLGKIGLVIGKILVYVFGFSSAIGLYCLGESNALFFSHKFKFNKNTSKLLFQVLYIIGMILAMTGQVEDLLKLVDIGLIILGIINICILFSVEKRYKFLKNNHIKMLDENQKI